MLASDFFRRSVVFSFQEDAIGIRLRDVIAPDNMMWDNMMWARTTRTASRLLSDRDRSWRKLCRTWSLSIAGSSFRGGPSYPGVS